MRSLLVFCILSLFGVSLSACPHEDATLSLWSSVASFNVPNATVMIPSGSKYLVDVASISAHSIFINGDLIFADMNISLTAEWIRVNKTGRLIAGSTDAGCAIQNKITITLVGGRTDESPMGVDPDDGQRYGSKGIAVSSGATIQMVGATAASSWTRLSQTAMAASSMITLSGNITGWKVGDEIVIASTDFHYTMPSRANFPSSISYLQGRGSPDQNERRRIAAIEGQVITLSSPLNFTHWGQDYQRAEVGLLTRNILLQGDVSSLTSLYGAHIIVRKAALAVFQGVEVIRMGQRGLLGRYPIHFHQSYKAGYNFLVKDTAVHDCFQRAFVSHEVDGVIYKNNVAAGCVGHCYFLEDGSETDNLYDSNLGVGAEPMLAEEPTLNLLPTDNTPAMFWITNPNNSFIGNAAVGATFGYWFSLPPAATGLSSPDYSIDDPWMRPRLTPLKMFKDNVAHSNSKDGLHIDDMVKIVLTTEQVPWTPRKGPFGPAATINPADYAEVPATFDGLISYKNRGYGAWSRAGPCIFTNFVLVDNLRGFNSPSQPAILQNSIVIGESTNIGTPLAVENGRSRPHPMDNGAVIKGWESYDLDGGQYVKDTTFINFTSNSIRSAGALSNFECGHFSIQSRNRVLNLTFIESNRIYINMNCPLGADSNKGWSLFDVDGSVTGSSSWIVSGSPLWSGSANPLMIDSSCTFKTEWNAYNCPPFHQGGYAQLSVRVYDLTTMGSNFKNIYNDNNATYPRIHVFPFGSNGAAGTGFSAAGGIEYGTSPANYLVQANLKTRMGYSLQFAQKTPTPPHMAISLDAIVPGDWMYLSITYPANYLPLTASIGNVVMTRVNSIAQITTQNQYFYDAASQTLVVKFIASPDMKTVNRWGFSDMGNMNGMTLSLKASCGMNCAAPIATPIPAVFTPLVQDDHFRADLQSCQSTNSTSSGLGIAFFAWNPTNSFLSFSIVHNVYATAIHLKRGAVGSAGVTVYSVPRSDSPVNAYFTLTLSEYASLLKGELYIGVDTMDGVDQLRGQIFCQGNCSTTTGVSAKDVALYRVVCGNVIETSNPPAPSTPGQTGSIPAVTTGSDDSIVIAEPSSASVISMSLAVLFGLLLI